MFVAELTGLAFAQCLLQSIRPYILIGLRRYFIFLLHDADYDNILRVHNSLCFSFSFLAIYLIYKYFKLFIRRSSENDFSDPFTNTLIEFILIKLFLCPHERLPNMLAFRGILLPLFGY